MHFSVIFQDSSQTHVMTPASKDLDNQSGECAGECVARIVRCDLFAVTRHDHHRVSTNISQNYQSNDEDAPDTRLASYMWVYESSTSSSSHSLSFS